MPSSTPPYEHNNYLFYVQDNELVICCYLILKTGNIIQTSTSIPGDCPLIIYCHGNASNLRTCFEFCTQLAQATKCHVLAFDYPGYGLSTGIPTERTTCKSMAMVGDAVIKMGVPLSNIILLGQSIGTGIAAYGYEYLSKYGSIGGLILMSPYTSISSLAQSRSSFGSLIIERFNTLDRIRECRIPIMIIHGERDEVIPSRHGHELYNLIRCPKWGYFPPRATHNEFNMEELLEEINKFFHACKIIPDIGFDYINNLSFVQPISEKETERCSSFKTSIATSGEVTSSRCSIL